MYNENLKNRVFNKLDAALRIYEKLIQDHDEEFASSVFQAYIADERYLQTAWEAMGENYITDVLGFRERQLRRFRKAVLTNRYF